MPMSAFPRAPEKSTFSTTSQSSVKEILPHTLTDDVVEGKHILIWFRKVMDLGKARYI